jgi:cyclase
MKKPLITNLFAALIITCGSICFSQSFESPHFKLEQIGDGVYAAIHKPGGQAICNGGFADLGEEVLVFDSFLSVAAASDLKKAIEELTGKPVRWVVNSHSHNDHIRGNQVFVHGASILGTPETRDYLLKHGYKEAEEEQSFAPGRMAVFQNNLMEAETEAELEDAKMWLGYFEAMVESYPVLSITPPDVVINDTMTIYGSKRTVTLIEFHQGHMESDIVLYLPEEKILFTGDLVFIGMHPFLADGDALGLRQTLSELVDWPVDVVVPGHGEIGRKEDIQAMISYIDMVNTLAATLKIQGRKPEGIDIDEIPQPYRDWSFNNFFDSNLKFLYESTTEK